MKVYNHKDAYAHLKYIFKRQEEDCFIATIDETVLHYGEDGGFDIEKAISMNIPLFDLQKKGGAMITSPGDIVYCFFLKKDIPTLNNDLRAFLSEKISKKGAKTLLIKNDLLIDDKKCFGFMQNTIGKMHFIGGHISINCNLDLIKQICTKPMEKVPGGLAEYGITTEEVVSWLNEFWFYYR